MSNPYQQSLDLEVLTASPIELVVLLYQGAIGAVDAAKRSLAEGDIKERSRQITKACSLLGELAASLNSAMAPELSAHLRDLYGYMHRRLCQANIEQTVEPLDDVRNLLSTLLEGWRAAAQQETAIEEAQLVA